MGLDPGIGIFHADRDHLPDRAALSYDVMEPVRPAVDAYLLALLTQRTLKADDFGETRKGACRLSGRLAAELAETSETWRTLVGPWVERVAHKPLDQGVSALQSTHPCRSPGVVD
jgi:CRISPR/Cas system-associated endonuclease Cas1